MAIISVDRKAMMGCNIYNIVDEDEGDIYKTETTWILNAPGDGALPTVTQISTEYQAIDGVWTQVGKSTSTYTLSADE